MFDKQHLKCPVRNSIECTFCIAKEYDSPIPNDKNVTGNVGNTRRKHREKKNNNNKNTAIMKTENMNNTDPTKKLGLNPGGHEVPASNRIPVVLLI